MTRERFDNCKFFCWIWDYHITLERLSLLADCGESVTFRHSSAAGTWNKEKEVKTKFYRVLQQPTLVSLLASGRRDSVGLTFSAATCTWNEVFLILKLSERSSGTKSTRGKEMSLSGDLGLYYKWPKSDPNAVFELPMRPKCSFWVPSCFIAANIVWTGQCDNSLFLWKLYNINQLDC